MIPMKDQIKQNLDNPVVLEQLYRGNKAEFRNAFNTIYSQIQEHPVGQVWQARLNYPKKELAWGTSADVVFVVLASLFAGLVAKIPAFSGANESLFYSRNIGFIVFPFLSAWFAWKQKNSGTNLLVVVIVFLLSALYINFLPGNDTSDTFVLACIHVPFVLWATLGISFLGNAPRNVEKRLDYLRYNSDLVVMSGLIIIAGVMLTGITIGLFELIGINITTFYFNYVVVFGLSACPVVATYLVRSNPHLVSKISPVIARIFTPIVLVMLVSYLGAIVVTGKDPYKDREFLLIFNVLLIGVMALIFFSVAETAKQNGRAGRILLFALAFVTVLVNGIALSAIIFRISEWGITPNRLAVLGGNVLILTNLLLVTYRLFKSVMDSDEIKKVEYSIASYLPVYSVWAMFVVFVMPALFGFR